MTPITLGLIVGNRGGFPDTLCESARATMLRVLKEEGIAAVVLGPQDTKFGSVETRWTTPRSAASCSNTTRARLTACW